MYRQIVLLISIIVAIHAKSQSYTQGSRESGERILVINSSQMHSLDPENPAHLSIGLLYLHNLNTPVTFVVYESSEGWDEVHDAGIGNVRLTSFNATSLGVRQVIYGFDLTTENSSGVLGSNDTVYSPPLV